MNSNNKQIGISEGLREWIEETLLHFPRELEEVYGGREYADCDIRLKVYNEEEAIVLFYWRKILVTFDGVYKGKVDLSHLSDEEINRLDEELVNSESFDDFLLTVSHYLPQ